VPVTYADITDLAGFLMGRHYAGVAGNVQVLRARCEMQLGNNHKLKQGEG